MDMTSRFGTSEGRAVVADELSFGGGRSVTKPICSRFETRNPTGNFVLIGDDARLSGEQLPGQCGNIVHEPSVGFKFIGALINEDKIVRGGEESVGLSIKGHYPEKDGIPACLLAAEAAAARGASLTEQLKVSGRMEWTL